MMSGFVSRRGAPYPSAVCGMPKLVWWINGSKSRCETRIHVPRPGHATATGLPPVAPGPRRRRHCPPEHGQIRGGNSQKLSRRAVLLVQAHGNGAMDSITLPRERAQARRTWFAIEEQARLWPENRQDVIDAETIGIELAGGRDPPSREIPLAHGSPRAQAGWSRAGERCSPPQAPSSVPPGHRRKLRSKARQRSSRISRPVKPTLPMSRPPRAGVEGQFLLRVIRDRNNHTIRPDRTAGNAQRRCELVFSGQGLPIAKTASTSLQPGSPIQVATGQRTAHDVIVGAPMRWRARAAPGAAPSEPDHERRTSTPIRRGPRPRVEPIPDEANAVGPAARSTPEP